ncbi:shikimate dehydrogenase [Halomicronema sp. CCY15110]|uniref:shikimate dehydrogenase n=1 Tax=Halomicronema sp. CCY15110 TaxID=2767773 RepID=UPI0019522A95|nr:shikimate dehydrogenase [Halomicronema sp. CCY15110]
MRRSGLTGKTQVLGIIGHPVEHSLSPPMQNAALAELSIDAVYVPFAVEPAALETAIAGLWSLGIQGFNVTIPHKQTVITTLTSVTDISQAVGAVNTVWRTDEGWAGTNTDVTGFIAPLQQSDRDWSQARVVVLGNGGAARAVVAGCITLGCPEIWLVGRSADKLQHFVHSWQDSPLQPSLRTCLMTELDAVLPATTLLVNTTPVGMHPQVNATPVTLAQIALLPPDAIAYDLIYTPSPTQFLQLAAQRGLTTFDGTEMLVQQGAAALQIWTQQSPPISLMRQTLRSQLGLS